MIGVGVLEVEGMLNDSDASAEIDGGMSDVRPLGKAVVDRIAVGAQHGIGVENRRQHSGNGRSVGVGQNRVGGGGAAVARHEHRNLRAGQAALLGHPAPQAGRGGR